MNDMEQISIAVAKIRVRVLLNYLFNQTEKVATFMPWGKPHPVIGQDNLPGLLLGHVMGAQAPHTGTARYEARDGAMKVKDGPLRVGSYTPDYKGNTRWLCLDFDGAGHSDPLADPEGAARQTQSAFTRLSIPAYLEKSGGGKGWHIWVFFSEPVPAKQARTLAHRVIPSNLPLANNRGVAMPRRNRGVEVFPKTDKPTSERRPGNLVWLPWYFGAPPGANQFYREEDGALELFVPDAFETVTPERLEAILSGLEATGAVSANPASRVHVDPQALDEFLRRSVKDDETLKPPSSDWAAWKRKVLADLPIDRVYGHLLTGERSGDGWYQCRDPESPSGSDSKSGNVADGSGQALRGTFRSWRTEECLSVFDFMTRYGQATSFIDAARKVSEWTGVPLPERAEPPGDSPPPATSYPIIVVNGRQTRDVRYDAETVLAAANALKPQLYVRANRLVRILMSNGEPRIGEVEAIVMVDLLSRVADWVRRSDHGDEPSSVPHEVARIMVATPHESFPWLDGVVTAPVYDAAGTLVLAPGFHRASGIYYHQPSGFDVPSVPDHPTRADIDAARSLLLDELLVDFPFVSDSDRAHAVAALILPFVRRMVLGPTPVHLYEAPTPGSGKTLAAEVVCMVATGDAAEPTTMPQDDEEVRKKITSLLLAARPVVLLDNVRGGIDSVSLAAVLTAEKWTDRLLGGNELAGLPNRAVWLISANNPTLTLEIARRCIRIRVEPAGDRPWERKNFKHWPLKHWVLENRSALVHAILTLAQAWISKGRPLGKRTLGSFEHWASTIGGILEVGGVPGFLENTNELYEAADVEGQEWRAFVAAWWEAHGGTPVAAKVLLELAVSSDLLPHVLGGKNERSQSIRLGKGLTGNRNRVYGDFRIMGAHLSHNQRLWQLARVDIRSQDFNQVGGASERGNRGMLIPFERDIPRDIPLSKPAPNLVAGDVVQAPVSTSPAGLSEPEIDLAHLPDLDDEEGDS
jgi:hypothetical protein